MFSHEEKVEAVRHGIDAELVEAVSREGHSPRQVADNLALALAEQLALVAGCPLVAAEVRELIRALRAGELDSEIAGMIGMM